MEGFQETRHCYGTRLLEENHCILGPVVVGGVPVDYRSWSYPDFSIQFCWRWFLLPFDFWFKICCAH